MKTYPPEWYALVSPQHATSAAWCRLADVRCALEKEIKRAEAEPLTPPDFLRELRTLLRKVRRCENSARNAYQRVGEYMRRLTGNLTEAEIRDLGYGSKPRPGMRVEKP